VHEIKEQIKIQIENLPRKEFAKKSLENSLAVVLKSRQNTVEMINEYAPEHLILCTNDYPELAEQVMNAGSVFLGNYTPESAGDYASGTNHTLPTNGWAKTYSGVNLDSFMKKITFQEITSEGLRNIGPAVEIMAAEELLEAHKNAVSLRLKDIKS
ncbi:MAG: histidinol dehydrogenase, partial [Tangfeifania sp.]